MKRNVFNSKMALFEDDPESLAEFLGISRQTLAAKRDGEAEFKRDEIAKIAMRWNLTPDEVVEMFSLNEGS